MPLAFGSALAFWSCQKEKVTQILPIPVQDLPGDVLPAGIAEKIVAAGFSTSKVKIIPQGYVVEGDVLLTSAELDKKLTKPSRGSGATPLQYTTNQLVNAPKGQTTVITVQPDGELMNSRISGNTDYYDRIRDAVARYQAVSNPSLRLYITYAPSYASTSGYVIHVHSAPSGSPYSGLAGFPNNGQPYGDIYLNRDYLNYEAPETVTTVIAHEIGHCIGFRHTDWYDRSISGCYGSESPNPDGANLVPGTGVDYSSWMLACYNSGQNRPFTTNDILSLKYLYSL